MSKEHTAGEEAHHQVLQRLQAHIERRGKEQPAPHREATTQPKGKRQKYDITLDYDPDALTTAQKKLLNAAKEFAVDLSRQLRTTLRQTLKEYQAVYPQLNKAMAKLMRQEHFDTPRCYIAIGQQAEAWLRQFPEFAAEKLGNEVLFVFDMPAPIARHWNKQVSQLDQAPLNKEEYTSLIDWRYFYDIARGVVPQARKRSENRGALFFRRLNPLFQHRTFEYYYVWAVSTQPYSKNQNFKEEEEEETNS